MSADWQKSPQMLLFDEPTNHLDMEAIEGLAAAIKAFQGGMVLVSHDFRLLEVQAPLAKLTMSVDGKRHLRLRQENGSAFLSHPHTHTLSLTL